MSASPFPLLPSVESFLDELQKIATGLAPPGAPTINSRGMGMGMPKLPRVQGAPKVPGLSGGALATPQGGPGTLMRTGF